MSRTSDNPTVPDPGLPFAGLANTGLLWLVNRAVFHPRGFALAIHHDRNGEATGWSLLGDGTEPWRFDPDSVDEDDLFARAEAFLASCRAEALEHQIDEARRLADPSHPTHRESDQ